MFEEAHKGLEAMSAACNAVKGEEWGEPNGAFMRCRRSWGACFAKSAKRRGK
jgi:hypothetical protein